MARQKPGPHPENPKDTMIKLRVDNITIEKIEACKKGYGINRSEVLRRGVDKMYEELDKK